MKIVLTRKQWKQIGKQANWDLPEPLGKTDESMTRSQSLITMILRHPKLEIVRAIKALGEESIAGFSGVMEEDVEDIVSMLEEYELEEILNAMEKNPSPIFANCGKYMVKKSQEESGEEAPQTPKLNPNFDVKIIKTPEQAEAFLISVIQIMPERFHLFLGLEKSDIMERIKRSIPDIVVSIKKGMGEAVAQEFITTGPGKLKNYDDAMELINRTAVVTLMSGHSMLLPLLGFTPGSKEVVDRLHENTPYMVKPMEIPEEAVPAEKEEYLNSVLDDFNAKKIDESEMKRRLKEYAGNLKITLIRTADNKMVLKRIG